MLYRSIRSRQQRETFVVACCPSLSLSLSLTYLYLSLCHRFTMWFDYYAVIGTLLLVIRAIKSHSLAYSGGAAALCMRSSRT